MQLTSHDIAKMLELSAVQAEHTEDYILDLVEAARQYDCAVVYVLPSWIPFVRERLQDRPEIIIGGAVGFPSGGNTTSIKVMETRMLVEMGCTELDVVINIGKLLSGRYNEVRNDLQAVVEAANGYPVKVILECHHLTNDLILKGCDICIDVGASYVKTGTGWAPTGATLENIALIKTHVGDAIAIKASGGIRGFETMLEMYRRGTTRFGVRLDIGLQILEQATACGSVIDVPLWRPF